MISEKYLIGVDVGTQSAKVVIFHLDGRVACEGRQPLRRLHIPAPQRALHPDDDLWDALRVAFKIAMTRFFDEVAGCANEIAGMGLCAIRCCRALLKSDGTLAYPVICWMDERLNRPYEYHEDYGQVSYLTTTSGYLTHRLTGERRDTCANYMGRWPIDDDTHGWSTHDEDFERCNTPRDMLFDVVQPGDILGHVTAAAAGETGVPAGLPVVATAHDKAVEALGAGTLDLGTVLVSLGTYVGVVTQGARNIKDAKSFWSCQASIPNRYLHECRGVRRGMWTVTWFCDQFGPGIEAEAARHGLSVEQFFNREAAAVPPGSDGLLTVPDWAPPRDAMFRKGAMLGFDGRHGRGHMYRSLIEGIALTVKNHADAMLAELGLPLHHLIVSGGGSNSNLFMQILTDVFGVPTHRNKMKGAAAVGAAINAGMAAGVFESYESAIETMVHVGRSFVPFVPYTDFYAEINDRVYRHAHTHLDPLLREHSPLVDQGQPL